MKCDKLKPLVFSISDLSFVDEPTPQPNFQNPHDHAVYKATEVEAAIEELKAANKLLKEHIANGDVSRITWIDEVIELKQKLDEKESLVKMLGEGEAALSLELEKTKQKLESVQASMYADVVDANMENRRLKRALWIARAERAKTEHLSKIMYSTLFRDFIEKWVNVELKCRAKAEEYK